MAQQQARLSRPQPIAGAALSIRGASIHNSDTISFLQGGQIVDGTIRVFNHSELVIELDDGRLVCRPWHLGDTSIERFPGTSSNWTIVKVEQHEHAL